MRRMCKAIVSYLRILVDDVLFQYRRNLISTDHAIVPRGRVHSKQQFQDMIEGAVITECAQAPNVTVEAFLAAETTL